VKNALNQILLPICSVNGMHNKSWDNTHIVNTRTFLVLDIVYEVRTIQAIQLRLNSL
jgi:hypothetical protein